MTAPIVPMVGLNIFAAPVKESVSIEVWPENWPTFQFFARIGTRWAHGMAGPVGLNWPAIYPLMDRLELEPDAWQDLLDDLEVMEQAALEVMHEKA